MDPVILFFLLGLFAGLARSELRLPPAIYELLSILLLLTIGLKGGVELADQSLMGILPKMLAVAVMGFSLPLLAFPLLFFLGRLNRADSASIAAHYGSVSVATYAVAVAFLNSEQIEFEAYMPVFLVVGGMTLLAVLAGSASYIAAPAAMRISVPEANPTLSLTASLGITFPFNIFFGVPLYYGFASALHGYGG